MKKPDSSEALDLARDAAGKFLDSLPERAVFPAAPVERIRAAFDSPLTEAGEPIGDVIRALAEAGDIGAVASAGPRYFGYVIGGTHPAGIAADWLTAAWDQNCGLWSASPSAGAAEEVVARWILELLDLPRGAGVGFVTGCQMANFTALASARHDVLERAGWDVERDGLVSAPRITVVASAEAHVTIHGALRMLGLGTAAVVPVETDGQGRMIASAARSAIARTSGPTIVCTQAGNVNTGSVDPISEIADAAHEKGAFVHVDGAFGLWARVPETRRHLVSGIEKADSWATDAHKWLNVPYDSGIAIVRRPELVAAAMNQNAAYLQKGESVREPFDFVPEFSRRGRAFPIWAVLKTVGRRGVAERIEEGCRLAALAAERLGREPGVEILADVVLNQALVRFHGSDAGGDDELTRDVIRRVQEERICWLSGTRWQGRDAMRFSVSNWTTTDDDVLRSVDSILRAFRSAQS